MKKTAFIQALVIVVLLIGTWVLFINRSQEPSATEAPVVEDPKPTATIPEAAVESPAAALQAEPEKPQYPLFTNMANVPPLWKEWMDYLQQQSTSAEVVAALELMGNGLKTMDPSDGIARLLELFLSGVNIETGLPFHIGEGGHVVSANSMRAYLLDWLGQIDPERAAQLARMALSRDLSELGSTAFALHMRNFAWGTPTGDTAKNAFLQDRFEAFLNEESWLAEPDGGVAETMDVAVYLQASNLTSKIAGLTAAGQHPDLRHAASLTLERLVDLTQIEAVAQLIDEGNLDSRARAGYVARLDPRDEPARQLLKEYLSSPRVAQEEAVAFLKHFPNMNQSLSHNLLSHRISITDTTGRLERALAEVRAWQLDPALSQLADELVKTEERLIIQLTGHSAP